MRAISASVKRGVIRGVLPINSVIGVHDSDGVKRFASLAVSSFPFSSDSNAGCRRFLGVILIGGVLIVVFDDVFANDVVFPSVVVIVVPVVVLPVDVVLPVVISLDVSSGTMVQNKKKTKEKIAIKSFTVPLRE